MRPPLQFNNPPRPRGFGNQGYQPPRYDQPQPHCPGLPECFAVIRGLWFFFIWLFLGCHRQLFLCETKHDMSVQTFRSSNYLLCIAFWTNKMQFLYYKFHSPFCDWCIHKMDCGISGTFTFTFTDDFGQVNYEHTLKPTHPRGILHLV